MNINQNYLIAASAVLNAGLYAARVITTGETPPLEITSVAVACVTVSVVYLWLSTKYN